MTIEDTTVSNVILMPQKAGSENCLPIGTRLNDFEITGVIGEGGFGIVYLAFDHSLQRTVAIKEYMPASLAGRNTDKSILVRSERHQETFEAGLKSFINEARLLAQFDHTALVKVYRFWEQNKTAYMAMSYYEGQTLKNIIKNEPALITESWLKTMLTPILEALEALYQMQVLHRDISPDNIMIQKNGRAVLLDFGAARQIIGDMTQALTVILKPGYAPIEQYADDVSMKQGPWTDIYALAAVLYFAIMKKPPPTSVARMIKDPLVPLQSSSPDGYSAEFLAAIDRGLSVRPDDRPQDIAEFRVLLGIESHFYPQGDVHSTSILMMSKNHTPTEKKQEPVAIVPDPHPAPEVEPEPVVAEQPVGPVEELSTVKHVPMEPLPEKIEPVANVDKQEEHIAELDEPFAPTEKKKSSKLLWASLVIVLLVGTAIVAATVKWSVVSPAIPDVPIAKEAPVKPAPPPEPPVVTPPPVAEQPPVQKSLSEAAVAWVALKDTSDIDKFEKFIVKYANEPETDAARTRLEELKKEKALKQAEEPPKVTGVVRIAVNPWGTVIVDGVSKGVTPPLKRLTLPEGKHQIKVINPNFADYVTEVEVSKKSDISISHNFSASGNNDGQNNAGAGAVAAKKTDQPY